MRGWLAWGMAGMRRREMDGWVGCAGKRGIWAFGVGYGHRVLGMCSKGWRFAQGVEQVDGEWNGWGY